jgi:Arc/MetJ-type ribon-helix-helix transcriptional regulator
VLQLTREAETKLRTLVECGSFNDESGAINELFSQFILNQDAEKRRMIMAIYKMNVEKRQHDEKRNSMSC